MNVLTDVLSAMRLSGGVILDAEFTAPWCVESHLRPDDLQPFLGDSQHVIAYHFITEGALICSVKGSPPVHAEAGDILLLTRNEPHVVGSALNDDVKVASDLIETPEGGELARVRWGGGGERTTMFCGFLGTAVPMTPLLLCLPSVLKVSTREGARRQWLVSSMQYAAAEVREGSARAIAKLAELLFAEAVQQYADDLPTQESSWLLALRDPAIGRALTLIHSRYCEEWTAEALAAEVGMSRSAFAARFTELLGESPIRYCARWRMQEAARLLRDSQQNIGNVAYDVGFNSEAAFSRAFKREFGSPPAAWRRQEIGHAEFA